MTQSTPACTSADPSGAVSLELWWQIQQFLFHEADLLDGRQFNDWLGLLDERISYRMPLVRNVRRDAVSQEYSGVGEAAWFDEGIETLRQRVAQLNTGIHWVEEPASRISHLVSNIRVLSHQVDSDGTETAHVRSRFLVYQNRLQGEVSLFVGKRNDTLIKGSSGWKILAREILIDQNVLLAKALTTFF